MDLELNNKTAVVTGGGSGIGKAVCLLLAEKGANAAVVDIHGDDAVNPPGSRMPSSSWPPNEPAISLDRR